MANGGANSKVIVGYLVEWDRFSAADAAANDPAKWKDWFAQFQRQGKTQRFRDPKGIGGAVGEANFANGAARVRFRGIEAKSVEVHLRKGKVTGKDQTQLYRVWMSRDQVNLKAVTWDLIANTQIGERELASVKRKTPFAVDELTIELRAIDDTLSVLIDGELVVSARDETNKEGYAAFYIEGPASVAEFSTISFDAAVLLGAAPGGSASATPALAKQATPTPATPKPLTEMEKWLAQVDGPLQESYQREVMKPFESAVAELKKGYLAALDGRIAAASTGGKLDDALGWRTERQRFAEGGAGMPADDADLAALASKIVATALPPLRKQFRTHAAKLEADRLAKARAAFAKFDAILTPAITTLTQRQRLDDALLLKTRREEVQKAWLAPLAGGTPTGPTAGTPMLQPATSPNPGAAASPAAAHAGPRPVVKKYPKGDDRKAAEWVFGVGGDVTIVSGGAPQTIREADKLPKGRFDLLEVRLDFLNTPPRQPIYSLEPLAGLDAVRTVYIRRLLLTDEQIAPLTTLPKLEYLWLDSTKITDAAVGYFAAMPRLQTLLIQNTRTFTGAQLSELADSKLRCLSVQQCGIVPEGFRGIGGIATLKQVSMQNTGATDGDLAHLTSLKLESLRVAGTKITLAGLCALKTQRDLTTLLWNFTPGRAELELAELVRTFPKIEHYGFDHSNGTFAHSEADMAALANLRDLRELTAYGSAFGDDAARGLLNVPTLKVLNQNTRSPLTDAGLAALAQHKRLEEIRLASVPAITDAGLLKLVALKSLKHLEVKSCPQITSAGLDAFKVARADVTLVR